MIKLILASLSALTLISLISCSSKSNKDDVISSLNLYDKYLLEMNSDSLAGMFAENGELGQEGQVFISGRGDIRQYLDIFGKDIVMLENHSQSESVDFKGDSALQSGKYHQKLIIHTDTLDATGQFKAVWVPEGKGRYLLRRMAMIPDAINQ